MKKLLLLTVCLLGLAACGEDADPYNEPSPGAEYDANLKLVRDCIATGGEPEYATGQGGVVTAFYGCRPSND